MTLLRDIESFLAVTGMTVATLERLSECPSLVRRLRNGSSPKEATELRVRTFMDSFDALGGATTPGGNIGY